LRVRTTGDDFGLPRAGRARRPGDATRGQRPHVGAQAPRAAPLSRAAIVPGALPGGRERKRAARKGG